MNARPRRRRQSGFTIVELLVAIVAASLVAAGTYTFFAGQQRVYDTQTKVLTLQENLWSSLEAVTRYVRSAGVGMTDCVRADSDGSGADTGDPPPGGPAPPQTGLRVFRAGTGPFRIAPLWIQNGAAGAPDTITVAYGRGATGNFRDAFLQTTVAEGQSASLAFTTLPGQTVRFLANEFILLVHEARANGDRGCSLFRITGIDPALNTLFHGAASPWNATADLPEVVPFAYPGGAGATGGIRNFGELVWVRLAIDTAGAPDRAPRLTMDRLDDDAPAQVLADGIEDMQVAYGCDFGAGGLADGIMSEGTDAATRLADDWTYNQTGDVEPVRCQRPEAVRITLTARTLTEDATLSDALDNFRPAAEDGVAGTPDRFRHRSVSATVRLRN